MFGATVSPGSSTCRPIGARGRTFSVPPTFTGALEVCTRIWRAPDTVGQTRLAFCQNDTTASDPASTLTGEVTVIADPPGTGNGVTLVSGMAVPLTAMWTPEIDAGREKTCGKVSVIVVVFATRLAPAPVLNVTIRPVAGCPAIDDPDGLTVTRSAPEAMVAGVLSTLNGADDVCTWAV